MSFEGKNLYGQYIILKKNGPRASSAPILGLLIYSRFQVSVYRTIGPLVHPVYTGTTYIQQISGERLQDHWSSGSPCDREF